VFEARNHNEVGDPDKLGHALIQIANETDPPLRFNVGVDALKVVGDKLDYVAREVERWRELSPSSDF
jgi:hypothetical protein